MQVYLLGWQWKFNDCNLYECFKLCYYKHMRELNCKKYNGKISQEVTKLLEGIILTIVVFLISSDS